MKDLSAFLRRARFAKWWPQTILLLALDAVCATFGKALPSFDASSYAAGIILSAATFYWLGRVLEALPRAAAFGAAALAGISTGLLLAANALLFSEFQQFLTPHMLRFVANDPRYLVDYAVTYLPGRWGIATLAFGILLAVPWTLPGPTPAPRGWRALVLYLGLPAGIFGGFFSIRIATKAHHADALTTSVISAIRYQRQEWATRKLRLTVREPLAATAKPPAFDVLFVINESWDKQAVPGLGGNPAAAPLLAARLTRPGAFLFRRGLANATATDVSVPSIVSGVGPEELPERLEAMPLLWDWAKAAGMTTLLVSAQRLNWNGLEDFLRTPGLDRFVSAPEIGTKIVNDLGVDDLTAAEAYCREVRGAPKGRSLLSVYNSNALHAPYQRTSDLLQDQPRFERDFDEAVAVLDQTLDRVTRCAEERGPVVVVMTGDHGHGFLRGIPRLYSYYPDSVGVPILILLPLEVGAANPAWQAALAGNVALPAANIDLVPTLIDLVGAASPGQNAKIAASLQGRALTRPLPEARPIVALNTNDFKKIDQEGFGVYIGSRYLVVASGKAPILVDDVEDPEAKSNLWDTAPGPVKEPFLAVIERSFYLKRIYQHERTAP